jgi:hypothetical protein
MYANSYQNTLRNKAEEPGFHLTILFPYGKQTFEITSVTEHINAQQFTHNNQKRLYTGHT